MVEIFLYVALFAILIGAGIGWLLRGRPLIAIIACVAVPSLGQVLTAPPIEHFTMHYLIGYTLHVIPPFIAFYLWPCVAAGALASVLATKKSDKHESL